MKAVKQILGRYSLDDARHAYATGRLSAAAWEQFLNLWTWSAPRLAGEACVIQAAFLRSRGTEGYHRRLNRVRRALGLSPV